MALRAGSTTDATAYYSFLKDPDNNKFYLNYHMLYSYDSKSGGWTRLVAHAFDRESMTLVFDGPIYINTSIPTKVVYGAHLNNQSIVLLDYNDKWTNVNYGGRVSVLWQDAYKYPADNNIGRPIVAVARGSHALYPVCGYYEVIDPNGILGPLKENACGGTKYQKTARWDRVLIPGQQYSLEALGIGHLTSSVKNAFLAFSGEWVDVPGPTNAKFPPFTEREKDTQTWVLAAQRWDNKSVPQYSLDLMADLENYLNRQPPVDIRPPTIPTGLTATAVSLSQIDLSWVASTDDVAVKGYNIYMDGVPIGTSTTTSYSNTGLTPSTQYCYTVSAYDAAGNVSVQSTMACATTLPATSLLTWAKTYGGTGKDYTQSIQQTTDGGYIVAGGTQTYLPGNGEDLWILKLDTSGNVIWQKTYGGVNGDSAYSIQQTTDGGYIVTGYTAYYGEAWVLKLDVSGNVTWEKTYGGFSSDAAYSIQQTTDGGYIVAGSTRSYGAGDNDAWVLKLNTSGNVIWQKTYGGFSYDVANSIQQTTDGGYIVTGQTSSYGGGYAGFANLWVLKLDASGNVTWQKTYGGVYHDSAYSIQQTTDGGYIVAGYTGYNGAGSEDLWVLKLDSGGNISWQKTYGGTNRDSAYSIQQTTDGGYIVAGYTGSYGAGSFDFWVLKLDASGNAIWQKTYGGVNNDSAYSIQQTIDGGYIVAGSTGSYGAGNYDLWVLKLDGNGDIGGTCGLGSPSNATPSDTAVTPVVSSAVASNTAATITSTNVTPLDTSASTTTQCSSP